MYFIVHYRVAQLQKTASPSVSVVCISEDK